jgi:hypothetical protein
MGNEAIIVLVVLCFVAIFVVVVSIAPEDGQVAVVIIHVPPSLDSALKVASRYVDARSIKQIGHSVLVELQMHKLFEEGDSVWDNVIRTHHVYRTRCVVIANECRHV